MGRVLHGLPAHAIRARPLSRAGAALDRAHARGERRRGRALGLWARRRASALRALVPLAQGPPPHRGAAHVGHPRGGAHARRDRCHGHPRGLRNVAPRDVRRPRERRVREPRREEEEDRIRDFRDGDRARAAAGRAYDGAAGAGAAVAGGRRDVPGDVPCGHGGGYGELHGVYWVLHRRAQRSGASDYGEVDVGFVAAGYLNGPAPRR